MENAAAPPPDARYYYGEAEDEDGAYKRLHEYWRSARKHLWLITGVIALVTTLAAIYMKTVQINLLCFQ